MNSAISPGHPLLAKLPWRGALGGGLTAAGGAMAGRVWPGAEIDVFAAGAAQVAGWLSGLPRARVETGWLLAAGDRPVLVTAACSGADFYLIVAALVGWRLAARGGSLGRAVTLAVALALPLTWLINGARVIAVVQAHRWVIPHLPEAYGAFAHMLTGVAVFLPALIALNLAFERHGNAHRSAPAA